MICEPTSLAKYLDKSSNIFFLFGSEIILKNDSVTQINSFLEQRGFTEKKIISEKTSVVICYGDSVFASNKNYQIKN